MIACSLLSRERPTCQTVPDVARVYSSPYADVHQLLFLSTPRTARTLTGNQTTDPTTSSV